LNRGNRKEAKKGNDLQKKRGSRKTLCKRVLFFVYLDWEGFLNLRQTATQREAGKEVKTENGTVPEGGSSPGGKRSKKRRGGSHSEFNWERVGKKKKGIQKDKRSKG